MIEGAPEERAPSGVVEYKNRVAENDGKLIPLERKTGQGTRLFMARKYIGNPNLETSPDAEKLFWGWREDKTLGADTGVVLIDVYADEAGEIIPIGHMDWWLQGDYANGGGNMHAAAKPRDETEQQCFVRWGINDNIAFRIT